MGAVVAILVAMIGGFTTIFVAIISSKHQSSKENEQIHVLVNGRLTEALTEIKVLRAAIGTVLDELEEADTIETVKKKIDKIAKKAITNIEEIE